MGKLIDLTGQKFGKWIVLEKGASKKTSSGSVVYWKCKCECGCEKEVRGGDLKSGKSTSCGCTRNEGQRDLTGLRFGRLEAIEQVGTDKYQNIMWRCKCDCGQETVVIATQLRQGKTQSCGCLQRERTSDAKRKDLTNMRFGSLVAIKPSENHVLGQKVFWDCLCDCGTITQVNTENLLSGATKSCGCVRSHGETLISAILTLNNISFKKEKTFKDFVTEKGYPYRFDFWVENKYIIEFDGVQHYKTGGWTSTEKLAENQFSDRIKTEYCLKNNIPIIRIPYTHLNNMCLNDLLLETSSFIIKKEQED